jgi:hypothetical protein
MATRTKRAKTHNPGLTVVSGRAATTARPTAAARRRARSGKANGKMLKLDGVIRAQAVTVPEADVTDEIAKGGPAFGTFLKSVGLAVAESQKALDDDLITTAKALSDQQIDVIAVFEQQLQDSDGQMTAGVMHVQKLPLVNYLMPTAYNFSRVFLQADMKVQEFNAANGFNIKGSSTSVSASAKASYGLGGFGASGSASFGYSTFNRSGEVSVAQDSAAGSIHMEATLEPRADIQLPRPFVLQKGPRLQVRIDSSGDIPDNDAAKPSIGRQIVLKAKLLDTKSQPLGGKTLDVTVSDPQFNRDSVGTTDNLTGETTITIKNEWGTGKAVGQEPQRKQALVTVSFGLVSQAIPISL